MALPGHLHMSLANGFALRTSVDGTCLFLTYGSEDVVKTYHRSVTVCELERDVAQFLAEQHIYRRGLNKLVFGNYFAD